MNIKNYFLHFFPVILFSVPGKCLQIHVLVSTQLNGTLHRSPEFSIKFFLLPSNLPSQLQPRQPLHTTSFITSIQGTAEFCLDSLSLLSPGRKLGQLDLMYFLFEGITVHHCLMPSVTEVYIYTHKQFIQTKI